jgi:uncharacterized membrane protein (UPF0127 family)
MAAAAGDCRGGFLSGVARMTITNPARRSTLGTRIEVADTYQTRTTGLLNRSRIESGEGLWIKPAFSIHTFGMKFPIDVIFLDAYGKVIGLSPELPPGRTVRNAAASSVLEVPAGTIAATGTRVGDELKRAGDLQRQTESSQAYAGGNAA